MRACTALGVVAVHAFYFTAYLNSSSLGYQMQNALVVALHFTREVFIFVTAFALVYVYNGRFGSPLQFWKKRALGVLVPYTIWSVIYVLVTVHFTSVGAFLQTAIFDILTGNASYQLYYILLTLQFYLLFPLFLPFIIYCSRRPWLTLGISFAVQVLLFALDFHTVQQSSLPFWQAVSAFQDRFLLVYPFYFMLGGMTALYFQQVRTFLLRHGWLILSAATLALAALWVHFALQVDVYHEGVGYASSVLQPIMVFYSTAIIFFALWLALCWVKKAGPNQRPRHYRFWHTLSDASFGVYLVHALILTALLQWLVPAMPTSWFEPLRAFLVWAITAGGAVAITILLMNIPLVSRLVGRSGPQKRPVERRIPVADLDHAPERPGEENRTPVRSASQVLP
jgi:probable poly-beta-1,6-N-acetyl-D-glucosamine export protein